MIKLNLGCGVGIFKDYINVDKYIDIEPLKIGAKTKEGPYQNAIYQKGAQFVKADILHLPFEDNYADEAELHQVIEHFNIKSIVPLLTEIRRVMKQGATLVITAPDFRGLAKEWVENDWFGEFVNKNGVYSLDSYFNLAEQIYGNQVGGIGETHLSPITPRFLQWALSCAGFKDFKIWSNPKGSTIPGGMGLGSRDRKGKVARCDTICALIRK